MAVGVSNLQFVDMNSTRNLFVFGVSVMLGSMIPSWLGQHPAAINTGAPVSILLTLTLQGFPSPFLSVPFPSFRPS